MRRMQTATRKLARIEERLSSRKLGSVVNSFLAEAATAATLVYEEDEEEEEEEEEDDDGDGEKDVEEDGEGVGLPWSFALQSGEKISNPPPTQEQGSLDVQKTGFGMQRNAQNE